MGPESTLRARVLVELRKAHRHLRIWGWPASVFTGRGHPDLFGVVKGRFLALELKTRTGRVTRAQALAIRDIRAAGGYAWVIRSVPQATMAVAWALEGKHPPMAEQALDIEDWFKELDEASAPAVVAEPLGDTEAIDALPIGDLEELPTEHQEAAARVLGFESAAQRDEVDPVIGSTGHMLKSINRLDGDIRAVGDRVTLCYESLNRIETVVMKLLALVMEDDVPDAEPSPEPEPPKRRRPRKAYTVLPNDS